MFGIFGKSDYEFDEDSVLGEEFLTLGEIDNVKRVLYLAQILGVKKLSAKYHIDDEDERNEQLIDDMSCIGEQIVGPLISGKYKVYNTYGDGWEVDVDMNEVSNLGRNVALVAAHDEGLVDGNVYSALSEKLSRRFAGELHVAVGSSGSELIGTLNRLKLKSIDKDLAKVCAQLMPEMVSIVIK